MSALFAATNRKDIDALRRIYAPEFLLNGTPTKFEVFAAGMPAFFAAFPDAHGIVEDLIAEGDSVSARWSTSGIHVGPYAGVEGTGRRASWTGITTYRFADGRVVEMWQSADALGLLQQIGGVRGPEPARAHKPAIPGLIGFEVKPREGPPPLQKQH